MKTARLITLIGSIILFVSGLLHSTGFPSITAALKKQPIDPNLAGIAKACWLTFSVELVALAIVAFMARAVARGGPIVLVCAFANLANGALLFYFLGLFLGVYLVGAVAVLFLVGGWLQIKAEASSGS